MLRSLNNYVHDVHPSHQYECVQQCSVAVTECRNPCSILHLTISVLREACQPPKYHLVVETDNAERRYVGYLLPMNGEYLGFDAAGNNRTSGCDVLIDGALLLLQAYGYIVHEERAAAHDRR